MLDAIAEIQGFVAGLTFEQFRADAKTLKAVTADLAILGEAARHVPDDICAAHAQVPWPLMRGMRNRMIHVYFAVDPQVVWDTAQQDLLPLVAPLKKILDDNPCP